MKYFENFFKNKNKWQVFSQLLIIIFIIGTLLSLATKITFIEDDVKTRPKIAVIAPDTVDGDSLKRGVSLYVKAMNEQGGFEGRPLEVVNLLPDDEAKISALVQDQYLKGAVGFLDVANLTKYHSAFKNHSIPLVTPIYLSEPLEGVVSMGSSPVAEASFAANYARNITRQRIMYVIRQQGEQYDVLIDAFSQVYTRFDTPIQQVWEVSSHPSAEEIQALIENVKKIDIGGLYLATDSALAAQLVKEIRSTGSILDIFAPSQLASTVFVQKLQELAGDNAKSLMNGITTSTPMLFDTANDEAQRFQTKYQQNFGNTPDWLAALSYDAAQIVLLGDVKSFHGVTGEQFVNSGRIELPMQMGFYNGDKLVSSPTQMLPIAKGTNFNYVDALRDGRVLYVNDRFMFKTNVVYTGFTINEISNIDTIAETAMVNMSVWFRFQGDFKPEDVTVLNSSEKIINFGEPEESSSNGNVQYRRYRVKENFKLNFTGHIKKYDHHVAGISFRHRVLNRNNLMYVVDVLGMPSGNDLINDLKKRKVTESGSGWVIDDAWVSQDIQIERGEGAPQYVGITGEQPMFSTITLGMVIKPQSFSARDFISVEYFIYIAIFGFVGVVFANILDSKSKTWYWAVQSWLLRLIFWPLLLLSVGNLVIDWSFVNLTQSTTALGVRVYLCLWWFLSVHLMNLALLRFVWAPLEARAGRKIPNIMKILVTLIMFAFAIAGIIATVFEQSLTSFLATSGVLAMIIGLAVQANIANIFSGIILNIERPFKVGDYIKINNMIGQVRDITWRTVRIESNEGPMMSLANSNVSEAFVENYSEVPHGIRAETLIHTPADVDVERVLQIVIDGIEDNANIIMKDNPMYSPMARFKGVENLNGQWVATFSAGYRVAILPKKSAASQALWFYVKAKCAAEGIPLVQANANNPVIVG